MPQESSKTLIETFELVHFFQKLAPKKVLGRFKDSKDRAFSLYSIIARTRHGLTDDEVKQLAGMTHSQYQRAIWKLKAALVDSVLELDLSLGNYSDLAQRLFALDLGHARVRILHRFAAAYSANAEAKTWLEEAKELEQWHLAISLLSPLLNWASLSGDKKEYDRLRAERRRFATLQSALLDGDEASQRATMVFAKSGAEHPEIRPMLDAAIAQLAPIVREHGTFMLQEKLLLLRKMAQQVTTDYNEALAICDETEKLLSDYPLFANRSRKSRNALTRLMCYVQTRRIRDAQYVIETSLTLFDEGDQNWHTFQEWHFILLMHMERFEEAHALMAKVMGHFTFGSQTEGTRDRWNLFRIYADLFTGRVVPGEKKRMDEKTGGLLQRLLRQFPSFKGDYEGYMMAAIVLELLIALDRREDQTYLFERVESLKVYKSRHLDRETQSNIFISLMQLMVEHDLDVAEINRIAAPMLVRMMAIKTIDRLQAQQVLHYEMLWAKTMELLPAYVAALAERRLRQ
ncbi:MAG: hypothetical protein Q8922_16030 [Bacteroidota bacterium]|nr:hypothetical protein [Bacteroidota bacterium]MDP4233082.1 hypothetical protein [Bacteroidota bacterium]MDP4241773.1 hypothetical protein [Bacteroidota bacterium]MDP4289423.1 hypothetical protein [Bacteroidota bacterium]